MFWRLFGSSATGRSMWRGARRLRTDERGTTAVEFGLVAMPFFMMLFGMVGIGIYYLTSFNLDGAIENGTRVLRTGQAQKEVWTAGGFKTSFCARLPGNFDCNLLRINVRSFATAAALAGAALPSCLGEDGNMSAATEEYNPGIDDAFVLVWVCYEWKLAASIPFLKLGNMASGSALVETAIGFRTENYQ
jgi:TadE-like protein